MCSHFTITNSKINAAYAAGASDEVFDAIAEEVQALNALHTNAAGYWIGC